MATLYHQLQIKAAPAVIYQSLTTEDGIGSWWDRPQLLLQEGRTPEWAFRPGPGHGVLTMQVLQTQPEQMVLWRCTSHHAASSPASAWTDTLLRFELHASNGAPDTTLDFRHSGWDETSPYLGFCNHRWGIALQALRRHCEQQGL